MLHTELLAGRGERRATPLVAASNRRAYHAYTRWGWVEVGVLAPREGALTFDALMITSSCGDAVRGRGYPNRGGQTPLAGTVDGDHIAPAPGIGSAWSFSANMVGSSSRCRV